MIKKNLIKMLIWGLAIGILASSSLVMGKKPAQEQTELKKVQVKAQSEAKKTSEVVGVESEAVKAKATEQEGGRLVATQTIEPKLVIEYKFDEPVVDIIWDEATMTVKEARALGIKGLEQRKASEVVKVQYPKVVFVASEKTEKKPRLCSRLASIGVPKVKSIKFLDKKGRLKKERFLQQYIPGKQTAASVQMSKNKKYIAVTTVKKTAEDGSVMDAETVILNTEGDELWCARHCDSAVAISPNGKYIIASEASDAVEVPVQIIYKDELIKEVKRIEGWGVEFSKDGSFVVLNVIEYGEDKQHIVVFDDEGNELWRKDNIVEGEVYFYSGIIEITDDDIIVFGINIIGTRIPDQPSKKLYFDKKGNLIKTEIINE